MLLLKFINFSLKPNNYNLCRLCWQTSSEQNTAKFLEDKSVVQRRFTIIGEKAAANNNYEAYYTFLDNRIPDSKMIFYRLKMVDKDGAFTDGPTKFFITKSNDKVVVYPNPATVIIHKKSGI